MTDALTPFDTGKRAEPKVWSKRSLSNLSPIERELEEDRYGRVDFDDDAGSTILNVWVERDEHGQYVVHVQPMDEGGAVVNIHG